MARGDIPAWQQGELIDAFCSLYSVANALRFLAADGLLTDDEISEILGELLHHLDGADLLLRVYQRGAGIKLFREMLTLVTGQVSRYGLVALEWHRPFYRRSKKLTKAAYVKELREHFDHLRAAAIVLVWRKRRAHWTVVSRISNAQLHLRDSTGQRQIDLRDIEIAPRRSTRKPVTLISTAVFFLTMLATEDA